MSDDPYTAIEPLSKSLEYFVDKFLDTLKSKHRGKANQITAKMICKKWNERLKKYRVKRKITPQGIRKLCNFWRQQGEPIATNDDGYWYATDPQDIYKSVQHLERRVAGMNAAIAGLKRWLKKQEQRAQETIFNESKSDEPDRGIGA